MSDGHAATHVGALVAAGPGPGTLAEAAGAGRGSADGVGAAVQAARAAPSAASRTRTIGWWHTRTKNHHEVFGEAASLRGSFRPPVSVVGSTTADSGGRRETVWALVVVLGAYALTLAASRVAGPAFDEERRFGAVRHATDVARAVSRIGLRGLDDPAVQGIYRELAPYGVLPGLLSGWIGEVLGRAGMDRLVASRLGWLLWTGAAPVALYSIVLACRSRRAALLAAAALFAIPRWVYAAGSAREPAVVTGIWLVVIATYLRSIPPAPRERRAGVRRRFRCMAVVFAVVLGFGVATTFAALGVVPVIVAHYWFTRGPATRRAWRRGRTFVPAGFLWALPVVPLLVALGQPELWHGSSAQTVDWVLSPLAPSLEPTLFHAKMIAATKDVQSGFAATWLLATTPLALTLLAALGGAVFVLDGVALRSRGERSPLRLGTLVGLVLAVVVVGPFFTPEVLLRFPPRVEIAFPFLAIAAAVAVDAATERFVPAKWQLVPVVAVALLCFANGLSGVPTASAAFGALAGGTKGAVARSSFAVGDGSEVASLATAINRLGTPRVGIEAHDVPRTYWALLNQAGRLKTQVDTGRRGKDSLALVRGRHDGAIAVVARDGATLWSLVK